MNYKKRCDSFLGIHFDFHAGHDCTEIGKNTTDEMIQGIIDIVKPDYMQCDCKGHGGISSYPTKVAYPAPGFIKDNLRIWRDVTAKNNIPLFMHYSGVLDSEALIHNPEWSIIDKDGEQSKSVTSVFGPYVDKLLIPQIKELIDEYNVDGIWVDGECWGTCRDYSEKALQLFKEKTGINSIPKNSEDEYYYEFTEFCRQGFRDYLEHYVDTIHKYSPNFQIASNWAYTSLMPEEAKIGVDFISGDYTPTNSYNSARFEGRCMANQGIAWDLMAWSFINETEKTGHTTKSIAQMKQEAAAVLALGGGFQVYFTQKRDGSIRSWQMKLMGELAKFCREREQYCHKTVSIPQVALLYSTYNASKVFQKVYAHWNEEMNGFEGILRSLLDNQLPIDIYLEHSLLKRINDFPVIVLPEVKYLESKTVCSLIDYVKKGGNLLLIGPDSNKHFKDYLNVEYVEESNNDELKKIWLKNDEWLAGIKTSYVTTMPKKGADIIGKIYDGNDFKSKENNGATVCNLGKGKIVSVWFNIGERYNDSRNYVIRDFIGRMISELIPDQILKVKGSHNIDVCLNKKDDDILIHLVNTGGPHGDDKVLVFDEIPPLYNIDIEIKLDKKPKKIELQPGDRKVDYKYIDKIAYIKLDCLKIYDIIRIIV